MKKIIGIILFLAAFVFSADYKPFNFGTIPQDSASQQAEFEYMLKYKLFGRDYLTIGNDVIIQDKSGWNGTAGYMTANARLNLGGPVLVNGNITYGDQPTLTSGPVRANTYTYQNQNGACINGYVCLNDVSNSKVNHCSSDSIFNSSSQICIDSVPAAPVNLSIPTIKWPDTISKSIIFDSQLNGDVKTIVVPDGSEQYDIYLDTIQFKLDHQKLQIEMQDGGRLTRIFVKHFLYHDHGQIQVVYRTDSTNYALSQSDYRGNVIIYTDESISIEHSDNSIMQGTMISTKEIYLACNINFAGQLLANQLRIGDTYNGKNFRFVKYNPDTIDVKLDKYGGLYENDSTVIIPIELSDTTDINVYFTYCINLKDGVTIEDFNVPPVFPVCNNNESKKVVIPTGSKLPNIPIQVNVKVDTLIENEYMYVKITDISGAILPNGKTDGELKIKIIDAPNSHVKFDTTAIYKFAENDTGVVDTIKVLNRRETTRFYLDSSWTDRYTLDSITGELKLVKYPLDYEATTVDMIRVTLKDTGNVEVSRLIPIGVIDINEAPSIKDTTFTLAENLPVPSIIGVLSVTDPDKKTDFRQNLFKIVEGDVSFAIDNSGRITSSKIFNYEKDPAEYTIKVMVYDKYNPTTLFDTATVTIKIGNTNEGPKFNTKDTTFFVDENTAPGIIGSVPAIDEDGDKITYKIVETVPFTIDTVGNISSTREFDYEKETGFTFKVVASDGTLSDTVKVSVRINNVNEPCEVKDTTFSVKENTTGKIGNVDATDKDKDSIYGTIKYSISDSVNYQIDKDGNVFVKVPFNYEDKKVDSIKVYITDGTFKDTATVVVKVIDIPEDIVITGKVDPVKENTELGTPVGVITGKDGDSTDVTYSINTIDFKIDPITGVITTNSSIDYETKSEYPVTITVKSTDGSKKDTTFIIKVIDVDEPVHAKDTTFTVPENTTGEIGKVTGEDEDGKTVKFTCDDTMHYHIDSITGIINVLKPFDYEKIQKDTLYVIVSDINGNKDTANIIINIKNVNETPELLTNDTLSVPENCKNCIVGIITAIDPDKDPIKYTVKESGFTIDSVGVLKTTNPLDYEKTPKVTVTIIAKDPSGAADTATYKIKVTDINEPVHVNDTTCTIKENYTGVVCKITATDEDGTMPKYMVIDTVNYSIDSTGQLVIKNPIDYEKKTKDTVKVIVTDNEFYDTAKVAIKVLDEAEKTTITEVDNKPKKDTIKTNIPDHNIEYNICEGKKCDNNNIDIKIYNDTTIKVCNEKKTSCDKVVFLFNDAPPLVTLTNAKSTEALIDYITIEEEKDNKIYVNKKENPITVTVKDTVKKTEKKFDIIVNLDTIPTKDIKFKEYNYLVNESNAKITPIGNNKAELSEVISVDGIKVVVTKEINQKTGKAVNKYQTVTYTKKADNKNVSITYKIDNTTGKKISDYEVLYMVDSCTKVTYTVNDKKKIVKNKEGNITYNITYDYIDDYGNKASAAVEIVFDDIPPKVEILNPEPMEQFNSNAVSVKWTVNGIVQDTLTLQRLEKGYNYIIRRYVDKAGNVAADTIMVSMKEAKDIDIELINPVTIIDQNKVDEYYSAGHKYNAKKPFEVKFVEPKNDTVPDVVGIGFKVSLVLPSVSPTGSLASLDDIVKNNQIPIDDKGNIVGASTIGIPVKDYVKEHCTEEFQKEYKKKGLNIPLYDVTYRLHLWVYTTTANYVNDFIVEFDLNDEAMTTTAGTIQAVIDWLSDKEGNVIAKNGHALGTGAYLVNLYSTSVAKHRCDYKEQKMGKKTIKKDETLKTFGYKRPIK